MTKRNARNGNMGKLNAILRESEASGEMPVSVIHREHAANRLHADALAILLLLPSDFVQQQHEACERLSASLNNAAKFGIGGEP